MGRHYDSKRVKALGGATTFAGALLNLLEAKKVEKSRLTYPCRQYQDDIEGFARDVLGLRCWGKAREMYHAAQAAQKEGAVIDRVVVQSSQKAAKSFSSAVIALWYMCCFEDATVILTGPRQRTVQKIIWKEISKLIRRSGVCLSCREAGKTCPHSAPIPLDGELNLSAETGIRTTWDSSIFGFVATDPEALAGFSGHRLCYIVDESSGVSDTAYEVIHGNLGASTEGFLFAISNPTKTKGWYYLACTKHKDEWIHIHISAEHCANDNEARLIKGLANRRTIDKAAKQWHPDSDAYRVRILGEFPSVTGGGLIPAGLLEGAVARYIENQDAKQEGQLIIGLDPAGDAGDNDAIAFAIRVGNSLLDIKLEYGLTPEAIFAKVLELGQKYSPQKHFGVVYDRTGLIGYKLHLVFLAQAKNFPLMQFLGLNVSDKATKNPTVMDRIRDELVVGFRDWLRGGGCVYEGCDDLAEEAACFSSSENMRGLRKVTGKKDIARMIGRSPDSFDAACLAVWCDEMKPRVRAMVGKRQDMTPMEAQRAALARSSAAVSRKSALGPRW